MNVNTVISARKTRLQGESKLAVLVIREPFFRWIDSRDLAWGGLREPETGG